MSDTINLSIIIPCYNEQKNLEHGVLEEVDAYVTNLTISWEVIVANDESTDESRRLVAAFVNDRPNWSLVDIPHGGKPAAVWAGIQAARGDIVLFTDMDQSTPIGELDKLLPWYDEGYDVVIGSRGISRKGQTLVRKLGSAVFLTLRQMILLRDIRDTQCGFKSCRRPAAMEVFPQLQYFRQEQDTSGWKVSAYDVELLYLWEKAGYKVKEVVVTWRNRDQSDTKNPEGGLKRYARESFEMLREVLRVKRNDMRRLYD
jgi:glycosyltransferase involved in cell wall biosynthesis